MDVKMLRRMIATMVLLTIPLSSPIFHVHASDDMVRPTGIEGLTDKVFVFVHGHGQASWIWYRLATMLQKVGFTTVCLDMASHGLDKTSADSVRSLSAYSKPLTNFLVNVTGQVILVSHALGGGPASYAMETFPEKISKSVFIGGVMPLNNEEVLMPLIDTFASIVPSCFNFRWFQNTTVRPTSFLVNETNAEWCFLHRSPPLDVIVAKQLFEETPWIAFYDNIKLTDANYGTIDRYYIKLGMDRIMPYNIQMNIIDRNPPKKVFLLKNSDHCPFFSETPYLFTLLKEIAFL